MAESSSRKPKRDRGLGVVEEAYCLLRSAGLVTLAIFQLGAVPFVAVIFFFWADMSRSSFAALDAVWASLAVVVAYTWMKVTQTWFCRRLWVQLHAQGEMPEMATAKTVQVLVAHAFLQVLALPLLVLALVFVVPLAWAYSFFQNATVLCLTRDLGRHPLREMIARAASLSHWRWAANHLTLAVAMLTAFLLWANVVMFSVTAPQLVRWLFGVESVFTLFPLASLANTSFLFASVLVTWLLIAPLTKAIFVVRCFYGGSRRSGADLLGRLDAIRSAKQGRGLAAVLTGMLVVFCGVQGGDGVNAQDSSAATAEAPASIERVEIFDRAISETLAEKSFQWRLDRNPLGPDVSEAEKQETGFAAAVEAAFERLGERLKRLVTSLFERGRGGVNSNEGGPLQGGGVLSSVLAIVSLLLMLSLLGWAFLQVRKRARLAVGDGGQGDSGYLNADEVDLENDGLVASQLPEAEWLRLARQQIVAGQYRLAVRALFLGCLANLGERGVIAVARHKSNRDYQSELMRRAKDRPQLVAAFGDSVRKFERIWYGEHAVDEEEAMGFVELCERIANDRTADEREKHKQEVTGA
jgi:hypothetical protein